MWHVDVPLALKVAITRWPRSDAELASVVANEAEQLARVITEITRDDPVGADHGIRPGQRVETPAGVLTRLFELTHAEARLAVALAEGKTLAEAAAKFGIKTSTARKQLNQILGKTRLHRQVDLVRALVGGPLGFRGPFATS